MIAKPALFSGDKDNYSEPSTSPQLDNLCCMNVLQGAPGERILHFSRTMVPEAAGKLQPAAAAFTCSILRTSMLVSIRQARTENQSPSAFHEEAATPCWRLTDDQHLQVSLLGLVKCYLPGVELRQPKKMTTKPAAHDLSPIFCLSSQYLFLSELDLPKEF